MTAYSSSDAPASSGFFSKDLLSLGELSPSEFKVLLDLSDTFRLERAQRRFNHQIPGTSLVLLFEKPSTRTRVSFEVGMFELGGHAVVLSSRDMQVSRGESAEDTAKILSGFCHAIAARVISHETLEKFSKASSVPVINALSDLYHPCQTLADFQTIQQCKRKLRGLKIAWVGDGNNVCNSLAIGAALSGTDMTVACPESFDPLEQALSIAHQHAEFSGSQIEVVRSPAEAVESADVVVTDTFVSMGEEEEAKRRMDAFLPDYRVTKKLMSLARPDAIFMHCLPAHRGEEVEAPVIDGPQSVVWQEAENRLHSQKALIYTLLKKYARPQRERVFLSNKE